MRPRTTSGRGALRLELAHVEVRYLPVLLPEVCPSCGASFRAPGQPLREVGYAEASVEGSVPGAEGPDALEVVEGGTTLGPPWHPVRYECAGCGLVLADGAAMAEEPEKLTVGSPRKRIFTDVVGGCHGEDGRSRQGPHKRGMPPGPDRLCGAMKPHPDELFAILAEYPKTSYSHIDYPLVASFLAICEELERDMVWADQRARVNWRLGLDLLRFQLLRWRAVDGEKHVGLKLDRLTELAKAARESWRGSTISGPRELSFLRDPGLRRIAERDYASLAGARVREEVKTVLILSGCVIEAVTLDVVRRDEPGSKAAAEKVKLARQAREPGVWDKVATRAIEEWTLKQLVGVCGNDGLKVLSPRAERVADTLRDFRNLVHPLRELIETATSPLSLGDAIVAGALTDLVLEEVSRAP